jgi:rod shape-determining protein MreD
MGFSATVLKALTTLILSFFFGPEILVYRIAGSVFWLEALANTITAPLLFALLGLFPSAFGGSKRSEE